MRSWIAATLGVALGASLGLATYDAVVVGARGRLDLPSLAGLWLASLGTAAVLAILPAVALGALACARLAGEAPSDWARRAVRGLGAREIVGASIGVSIWAALVGGASFAFAESMRTDSLRLTAVSLVAVAALPIGWLCGAAAGAVAGRRLSSRAALAIPGLVVAGLVAVAATRGETLTLLGPDATISPAIALALGAAGLVVGARGSRRVRIVIAAAIVLACASLLLPRSPDLAAALAFDAPNASVLGAILPTADEAKSPVRPSPPPQPFRLGPGAELRRRSNVVLVTVDSLRPDHVGCYGYRRATTPNIDALARRSVRFERAWAQGSSTRFSVPSFMTSRYMSQLAMRGRAVLPQNTTLAEVLQGAGFRTAGLMATTERGTGPGVGQGFESFRHSLNLRGEHPDRSITDDAIAILEEPGDRLLFLWVHYYDPHSPFVAPEGAPSFGTGEADRYDSEIWSADREVGRLVGAVDRQFGPDGAVIILTGDHGEAFGEHGKVGHSGQLHEELLRVPLLARVPGARAAVSTMPAALLDIMPTVLDLAGALPSPPLRLEGRSLLPQIAGGSPDRSRLVFEELRFGKASARGMTAVHSGRHHLIVDAATSSVELFDLGRDPLEQRPLGLRGPAAATAERMRRSVLALRARIDEGPRP
ncbi:MAG: sulfatase [Deltaproteobacteria bacterium]|nr:sulfatase [Deltaproteobacteria bacterium]